MMMMMMMMTDRSGPSRLHCCSWQFVACQEAATAEVSVCGNCGVHLLYLFLAAGSANGEYASAQLHL
jgi:hypothetical protein